MWLMSLEDAHGYLPLISRLLKGDSFADLQNANNAPLPSAVYAVSNGKNPGGEPQYYESFDEAPEGSYALVHVTGALMKNDFCFTPGTATLKNRLQTADKHPNISGHIIVYDTPGGMVDGTKSFADAIKATSKPAIGFVDELAASAGYWLLSGCDEVILGSETAIVGSIGTMISMRDVRGYYEKEGIKFHDIFAEDSSEKNRTYLEALKGNYKPIQEQMLNPTNDIFLASVKANRPNINDKALKGRTFLAADAINMGMADVIGNFEFALERLEVLKNSRRSNNQPQQEMFGKNKFTALTAALMVVASLKEGEEPAENQITAINEEIEKLELSALTVVTTAGLKEAETEATARELSLQAAQASRDQAIADLATANESIAKLTQERDAAQALAAKYGSQPGDMHTDPSNGQGDMLEEDESQKLIDSLPHNMAVDGNFMFNHKNEE